MRNFIRTHIRAVLLAAAVFTPPLPAAPSDSADLQTLRAQVQSLEQQLRVLARQIEIKEEAAAAAPSPKVTVNDKGFSLASADGANSIRLRGLVQLDSRLFFDDGGVVNNTFVLRRARLITEGVLAKNYGYQLVTEFGGSSVSILDANFFVNLTPFIQVKVGKFKAPVGLELLQSDSWTAFNERSIVTNLVPNRDLGIQVSGDIFDGRLNYTAGVFNGVADGASSTNADYDQDKDFAGRLFASPFKNAAGSPLQGLSFGVAGSIGRQKTASGRTSGYRTDGQQTFFTYNPAAIADGQAWRISPQLDYRHGPLGVIGEYVASTVNLRPSATGPKTELTHNAWQATGSYVLTGEDSSYNGVVPRTNFDLGAGTWGAFEVTGRYANLKIDDGAFPLFASAASNADEATSIGFGLNWYLSKAAMLKIDYYQTRFGFSSLASAVSAAPVLRQNEKAFITRFQLGF